MTIKNFKCSSECMHKLGNIADVGAKNASEYLTQMTGKKVSVSIPWISKYPYEKIPQTVGNPSKTVTAIFMGIEGDLSGVILIVFPFESALVLSDMLLGRNGSKQFDSMAESALMEATGNILANAYLNAFSEKLDLKIKDTIPYIGTDMLNSLMDGVLSKFAAHASETLLLKNNFRIDEYSINGHAFILFDPASFELIAEKVKAYKE